MGLSFSLKFSDLREHRFHHNCRNPVCRCGRDDETPSYYFLGCPMFALERTTLLSNMSDVIRSDISVLPDEHLTHILLYGSNVNNSVTNKFLINETITFIRNTERFTCLEAFR